MIKKLKDSIFLEIGKRFRNPFLWAFALSWIFFNWEFIYIVLFLDEKYVSMIPWIINDDIWFTNKYEYLKSLNLVNNYNFLLNPLYSSFLIILFTEWWTTIMNIFIKHFKNKIEWYSLLTKEESERIKSDIVNLKKDIRKSKNTENEFFLTLEWELDDYKRDFDNKIKIELKKYEKENLKVIKSLEESIDKCNLLLHERSRKVLKLEEEKNKFNKNIKALKDKYDDFEKNYVVPIKKDREALLKENNFIKKEKEKLFLLIEEIKKENLILNKKLNKLSIPLKENYKNNYLDFKKSKTFSIFESLIEEVECNNSAIQSNYKWMDLKYLEIKWIINKETTNNGFFYEFTEKWNKFIEYLLDEINISEKDSMNLKDY